MDKSVDPFYYQDNEDGSEPHGYWIKSSDYEKQQRWERECQLAVEKGIACDLDDFIPF